MTTVLIAVIFSAILTGTIARGCEFMWGILLEHTAHMHVLKQLP